MARTTSGTASWGVTDGNTVTSVTGIVTECEVSEEPSLAPEYNEVGAVVKQTQYDVRKTATATVEVASSVNAPGAGTQITVAGLQGYVTSSRVVETNQAYRKIQVTVETYANCAATTAAT